MNERPVRKTTPRKKSKRTDAADRQTAKEPDTNSPAGHSDHGRPSPDTLQSLPEPPTVTPPDTQAPPAADRQDTGGQQPLDTQAAADNAQTMTEDQQLVAAKAKLRQDLGIEQLERTVSNLIQELQARNGMVSTGQPSAPRGIGGIIESIANAVGMALTKIPAQNPNQEGQLLQRLLDMTLNHYAVIDQVYLKSAGIIVAPPVQHMPIAHA